MPITDVSHHRRRRVGPKKMSAAPAPTKQNSVGTRWHKHARREQQHRRDPRPPRAHAPDHDAEEDERHRQPEREGVLPRHGRVEVAAVDGEGLVEQERQGEDGEDRGPGPLHARQTSERPRRDGKGDRAEDGDELEGDVEGDDVPEERRQRVGEREIEGVEGQARRRRPGTTPSRARGAGGSTSGTAPGRSAPRCRRPSSSCWPAGGSGRTARGPRRSRRRRPRRWRWRGQTVVASDPSCPKSTSLRQHRGPCRVRTGPPAPSTGTRPVSARRRPPTGSPRG